MLKTQQAGTDKENKKEGQTELALNNDGLPATYRPLKLQDRILKDLDEPSVKNQKK